MFPLYVGEGTKPRLDHQVLQEKLISLYIALGTLLSTALPIAFALGILSRLLMTASHVFPNYLIHYHFLPEKVNK